MITIINKNNMNFPNDNFLTKEEVSTELENNPYGNYLILIEEDKITGYIYYSDIYERAEINQFEVKITHRNCGKGKRLLKEFIKLVKTFNRKTSKKYHLRSKANKCFSHSSLRKERF